MKAGGTIDASRSQGESGGPLPPWRPKPCRDGGLTEADGNTDTPDLSEAITGSGSLLPSSESDWGNAQWPSVNHLSSGLPPLRNHRAGTSPVRQRTNTLHARSTSPYLNPTHSSTVIGSTLPAKPSGHSYLDPTSGSFRSMAYETYHSGGPLRSTPDENARRPIIFGTTDAAYPPHAGTGRSSTSNASGPYSGYHSGTASRSGSLPPSRHGVEPSHAFGGGDYASGVPLGAVDAVAHRPNQPSRTSLTPLYAANGGHQPAEPSFHPSYADLLPSMAKMDLGRDAPAMSYPSVYDYTAMAVRGAHPVYGVNANVYRTGSAGYESNHRHGPAPTPQWNPRTSLVDPASHSPGRGDGLHLSSTTPPLGDYPRTPSSASFGSIGGVGPTALLERRLRSLQQQEQPAYLSGPSHPQPFRGSPYPQPGFDYGQPNLRLMNPLAPYWPGQPTGAYPPGRAIPRGPMADTPPTESLRSAVLEDFRSHHKGTKRYELKVSASA